MTHDAFLYVSSGLPRGAIQDLMGRVDVWSVENDGSVDFRVKRDEFEIMKEDLPGCKEEVNVEDLVREMELKQHHDETPQGNWFENYVRTSACIKFTHYS